MKNTKEFLINNCKVFEKEGELWLNGKYKVRPIKYRISTVKHKYGKDMSYEIAILYNYETKKYISYTKQQLLYIWYKGDIPKGYDVDHIDDNPLNNDINNLQLITRAENLRKRKIQSNQYIAAKANGIKVDNSTRKKYEHSAEFLKKQEKKSAIINMEGEQIMSKETQLKKVEEKLESDDSPVVIINEKNPEAGLMELFIKEQLWMSGYDVEEINIAWENGNIEADGFDFKIIKGKEN